MQYGFCCVALCPVRRLPAHEAEMVSQLLFGEAVTVLAARSTDWLHIRNTTDGYEGWCQFSHIEQQDTPTGQEGTGTALAEGWVNELEYDGSLLRVPMGAVVSGLGTRIQFGGRQWFAADAVRDEATIKQLVFRFLNTPYLWGGRSVFGVDCSGLTQMVFRFLNIVLPRDAHEQADKGQTVDFLQQARCGDLAFFDNDEGRIIHTGILLSNAEIIHAAGIVRIDKMDHLGIVHAQTGKHTHRLRIIRRYW